jgi:hypothetical protein
MEEVAALLPMQMLPKRVRPTENSALQELLRPIQMHLKEEQKPMHWKEAYKPKMHWLESLVCKQGT